MNIRSADIEQFLREEVDSSIRVRSIIGLDLGSKGVAFQYQSPEQMVWVVLEYTTAASLILGPSYAPLQAVEAIVSRETFQDGELEKLSGLHVAFLKWLQTHVDNKSAPRSPSRRTPNGIMMIIVINVNKKSIKKKSCF